MHAASGFGYRARYRRIYGERVGHLVDRQRRRHRKRNDVYEFACPRRYHDTTDDVADAAAREQLDEAIVNSLHFGARIGRERQYRRIGLQTELVDLPLR